MTLQEQIALQVWDDVRDKFSDNNILDYNFCWHMVTPELFCRVRNELRNTYLNNMTTYYSLFRQQIWEQQRK